MALRRSLVPVVLSLALLAAFYPTQSVHAAVFLVNSTVDTVDALPGNGSCADSAGRCTLRAAIMEANAYAGADTITLPPGIYTLTLEGRDENNSATGDLDILGPLTITGSNGNANGNPDATIIQAGTNSSNGIDKVMSINPYLDNPFSTTLQALTIRYGYNTSSEFGDGHGGGLDWDAAGTGRITIFNCVISDNTTLYGGGGGVGLFNAVSSPVTDNLVAITRSTIRNNRALSGQGGGVLIYYNLPFTLSMTTIRDNTASSGADTENGSGGGLFAYSAEASSSISGCTITGNTASGRINNLSSSGSGGGVYIDQLGSANVLIHNTTISSNTASKHGGGAYLEGGDVVNVTVTGNQAGSDLTGGGSGGGIYSPDGLTSLRNTIVVQNRRAASLADDLGGSFLTGSSYHNLVGPAGTGGLVNGINGNLVGVTDPRLGPLADNGGPTMTHALLPGSPALDAGNNAYPPGSADQRSYVRVLDAADPNTTRTVDIGAFEANPMIPDFSNASFPGNTTRQIEFSFGDSSYFPVSFTVTSSNPTLVPNNPANLTLTSGSTSSTRMINITPAANQTGVTTITVTATASNGSTISDTFQVTVYPAPDLTVTKTHASDFLNGQSGAVFTLTVGNQGLAATTQATTLTDSLPDGLAATEMSGEGWDCDVATLTCTRSSPLASGASYPPVTLTVNVSPEAPSSLTNTAAASNPEDMNPANNSASDSVNIFPSVDLSVSKVHAGHFHQGQQGAVYTLTVTNQSAEPSAGTVTLTDLLPAGLTATAMQGAGWDCDLPTLTCARVDALAAGASYPSVTLTVNVAADAPGLLLNQARVSSGRDGNTANNTVNDSTQIEPAPDLTLSASHSGDFRQGQQGALFSLEVINSGEGLVYEDVVVQITAVDGLTFTGLSGSGWDCSLPARTCSRSDALPAWQSYPPVTLTVNVAADAGSPLTLAAAVSGGGEIHTGNNAASDTVNVIPVADLTVTKTHTGDFTRGQDDALFTLTVSNTGAGLTTGLVTLQDLLPPGLSGEALSGSGWACDLPSLACTRGDALASGASYPPVSLVVAVAADAPETVVNQAQVAGGGEAVTGNNTAADTVTVLSLPDLAVTKSHTGDFRQGQTGAQYGIYVSNGGTAATSGAVTVTDTLPSGLTATALSGAGWICDLDALACTRDDPLAPGSGYPPLTVTVSVATDAPGHLINQALVSGGGQVNTLNDTAVDPTRVYTRPAITVQPVSWMGWAGQPVVFNAAASGDPTPTVHWQESQDGGQTWQDLDGQTGSVLSLIAAPEMHGRQYRAIFTNEMGQAVTTGAGLTVYYAPLITEHPLSQTARAGQRVTLRVGVTARPACGIFWQVSADQGLTWSDLPGATQAELTFLAYLHQDGFWYRAAAINEGGVAFSDPAVLIVEQSRLFFPLFLGR